MWTIRDVGQRGRSGFEGGAPQKELHPLALRRLVDGAFISLWSERGPLRCYEFGALLVRTEVTPANLPVEPAP